MVERTDNATILEQLLSYKTFTIMLYEIEVKDKGSGVVTYPTGEFLLTDTTKTWAPDEWLGGAASYVEGTSYVRDGDGNKYQVKGNTATTITLHRISGGAYLRSGEYTLHKWYYLANHVEAINDSTTAQYTPIDFGVDSFGRTKSYYVYPIHHQLLEDTELGKFPQLSVELFNPGQQLISSNDYFYDYDFYSYFERYNGLQGNTLNITIIFTNSDGEIISDADVNLPNQFTIINSSINKNTIKLNLSSYGNLSNKKLPGRIFTKNSCSFIYKDNRCGYTTTHISDNTEVTLSTCNKSFRSFAFGTQNSVLTLTKINNSPTSYWYSLPDTITTTNPTEFTNTLKYCVVEYRSVPYLWRIINVDTSYFPYRIAVKGFSTNGANHLSLFDVMTAQTQLESAPQIEVSIISKECCVGHTDVGSKHTYCPQTEDPALAPYCLPNELIFNGDFYKIATDSTTGIKYYDGWDMNISTGDHAQATNMADGVVYIDASSITESNALTYISTAYDRTFNSKRSYDETDVGSNLLEYGACLQGVIKYYAADVENPVESPYMRIIISVFQTGSNFWTQQASWSVDNQSWTQGAAAYNYVPLRPYAESLNMSLVSGADFTPFRYIQMSSYAFKIPLVNVFTNSSPSYLTNDHPIEKIEFRMQFRQCTCLLDSVSLHLYNQFERYGGFPSIPTSKYWYI